MPVRIERQAEKTPARLHNHFELNDEHGNNVGLDQDHVADSIRQTVGILDEGKHFVVAEAHVGINLLKTKGILFERKLIATLTGHENLLGLALIEHRNTFFQLLLEIAKSVTPGLVIPVFRTPEQFEEFMDKKFNNNPAKS